ncbi:Oligopeptidase A [Planctomycetes bacterium Pan216]|uniref:oligopeptidase A n=1 Tax=Kolteria novifilia TaxID=2527975 RepID=A0A518BAV4_9BACT|nr:Oligopeptidase A [Planctomycetes bacterium Pan216]
MPEENPLLVTSGIPPLDRIKPSDVVPGVRKALETLTARLEAIESSAPTTWDDLVEPLEEIDARMERVWGPVGHLMGVQNSDELREAHDTVLPEVVAFDLRLRQSRPIFDALESIRASDAWETFNTAQRRVIELKLRGARNAGVGLDGAQKERFNEIERELSELSTKFSHHVLDATKAFELIIDDPDDTEGWPDTFKQGASQSHQQAKPDVTTSPETGPWRITLDAPSLLPFLQHSRRRDQREQLYRAMVTRAAGGPFDNSQIVPKMLRLRSEKAKLLGFDDFAALSLDSKMAPSVAAVEEMWAELEQASRKPAEADLEDLRQLAADSGQAEPIAHWDVAFWAERLREKRFDFTDEQLRPFFPMPKVLDGMFGLTERLFGVTIKPADGEAPIWHKDVRFFHVYDGSEQIASLYLDPYSRPHEKRGGAWMDQCLSRCRQEGELQLPIVYLCCNGTPPVGEKPSLMTFREVETLFHEFGHGLQGMLTTVDHFDVAGTYGIEWDAVEIASQFMENWCYHKPTLLGMTEHVETGEPLPDDLFDKLCKARTYRAASGMLRQMTYGMTDMALHHGYDSDGEETPDDVSMRINQRMSILPPLPEARQLCAFSHIFGGGYAAGYYSYKWSEVISADAFAAFEEAGLDDEAAIKRLGERYRETILAQGGGQDPMDVYHDFRGRAPSTEALLRHYGLA